MEGVRASWDMLFGRIQQGDLAAAEQATALIYNEIRRIASRGMRRSSIQIVLEGRPSAAERGFGAEARRTN